MGLLKELKNRIFPDKEDAEYGGLFKKILIMGLIGVVFLFAGNLLTPQTPQTSQLDKTIQNDNAKLTFEKAYENRLARELEEIISLIKGVGETKVQLKVSHSTEYEYEHRMVTENRITSETDLNSGERRIEEERIEREPVIIRENDGREKPVIRIQNKPEITGIIVVAQGAESVEIKYEIYKAISSLLGLPKYKISVLALERR